MKRPSTMTLALGHPVVGWPVSLGGAYVAYLSWQNANVVVLIVALLALARLATMIERAGAYRAWQRNWEALDEDAPRRAALRRARIAGIVIGGGIVAAIVVGHGDMMLHYAAFAPIGLAALAAVYAVKLAAGWLRRRRHDRTPANRPVAIVAKPMLPVPTLADAYKALPEHCAAILRGQA